ncbi:MAG: thioredoxin family protein [Planctomycetota bacterium]
MTFVPTLAAPPAALALILVCLGAAGCGGPAAPVYTVEKYDPARDPAVDLASALELAQAENKHVILQIGGEWCRYCHLLEKYFHDTPTVAGVLEEGYLVMKVNWSKENKNEEFFAKLPDFEAFPHLFFLDASGSVLHSQGTGELEQGKSYNEQKLLAILTEWAPKG